MTLDARSIIKEGWLTVYKSRKPTFFSSRPVPDKLVDRGWAVLHQFSSKGPVMSFYQDNRKESRVMRRDKIELMSVRGITQISRHPKQPHCFTFKFKGSKRILLNCDTEPERGAWLKALAGLISLEYSQETVIWEYLDDGGLWQACPEDESFKVEAHFFEGSQQFHLGDYHYNLHHMTRGQPQTKNQQRVKRTQFVEERRDVLHSTMKDLPAIWEWGDTVKGDWHPFERDTNIQIEDMYDSGSQWAELTLCLPSPMPFLLDLHDMKLVNFRTAVRYSLRRIDQSDSMEVVSQARHPSPDDFENPPIQDLGMSPNSPLFQPLQDTLQRLQMNRKAVSYKRMLGEGAFGEVYLAEVAEVPGYGDQVMEVAVKQLRLSDFIARHGHHSQQMEDFLREAKEMSKIDYPRVVKLMAVCTLDYPMLLIEEYMNLGDLLGVLKDSRPIMPLATQLNFAFQVADGMRYLADDLNCVHRDLAARNILVSQQNPSEPMEGKIADFGLSRHLYSEMYKHQGSKPRPLPAKWMALESLMYFTFTTKSDVWSYGVLLWEIMTLGRSPYPGVENRELLEQIEEKGLKLSKPKPCSSEIYEIILNCTQHQENERPTFKELKDIMAEYLVLAEEGKISHTETSASPSLSTANSTSDPSARHSDSAENSATGGQEAPQPPRPEKSPHLQRPPSPKTLPPSSFKAPHLQRPPSPKTPPPSSFKAPLPNPVSASALAEATPTSPAHNLATANQVTSKTPNGGSGLPAATTNGSKLPGATVITDSKPPETQGDDGLMEMTTGGHLYYLLEPNDKPKQDRAVPNTGQPVTLSGRPHLDSGHWRTESGRPICGSTDSNQSQSSSSSSASASKKKSSKKKKKEKGKKES